MNIRLYILLLTVFCLSSCFKEEEPVTPHIAGAETTINSEVSIYDTQSLFDLNSGSFIYTSDFLSWDLGFDPAEEGWRIILNTAKFMQAANTESIDFEAVNSFAEYDFMFDKSDGNKDSTAICNWVDTTNQSFVYTNQVYIIDRGLYYSPNSVRYKKIVFQLVNEEQYIFKYADLNGDNENIFTLTKADEPNYNRFSFEQEGEVIEDFPHKDDWDLLFTQYSTIIFTDIDSIATPYVVRGVLLNPNKVIANIETELSFREITFDYVQQKPLLDIQDIIGYEWKDVEIVDNQGIYTTDTSKVFIIQDIDGFYFKLRFIDFYNDLGVKGYPTFEFQKL